MRQTLGPGNGGVCLDVACGTGLRAPAVRDAGWSPVGFDISADQLRLARHRLAGVGARRRLLFAGVRRIGDGGVGRLLPHRRRGLRVRAGRHRPLPATRGPLRVRRPPSLFHRSFRGPHKRRTRGDPDLHDRIWSQPIGRRGSGDGTGTWPVSVATTRLWVRSSRPSPRRHLSFGLRTNSPEAGSCYRETWPSSERRTAVAGSP